MRPYVSDTLQAVQGETERHGEEDAHLLAGDRGRSGSSSRRRNR